ncbi:MAG: hypothetical protein HYY76_10880 [Acidobacteria bacterium]|nr:hypothetical protein [Acidobacteriota bacterium]
METILDQHEEAMRAFHESNDAFDRAMLGLDDTMAGLKRTIAAVLDANRAQREALNGIIAANRAALTLYNEAE